MPASSRKTALDLHYMKLLHLILLPVAGWPNLKSQKKPLFNVHKLFMSIQLFAFIGEIMYLHDIFGEVDFLLAGDVYITMFLTIVSMVRISLPQFETYGKIFKKYALEFHLIYFKHKGESYKKVFLSVDKVSRYFTYFMTGAVIVGMGLFNLSPMYVNVKNGAFTTQRHNLENLTLEFSVKYKFPGYVKEDHFILTTIFNLYLSLLCSASVVCIDLLMILMVFQIIGHLEVLALNMKAVPKPRTVQTVKQIFNKGIYVYETEMFDRKENFKIKQILQQLIDHHNLIISFTEDLSTFFGPLLGVTYLFHLVCCCLLLLECSRGDSDVIVQFGPLTGLIFMQLIQISVIFEVVGSKSKGLIDCVYDLPWECMDRGNRQMVNIMLLRVQTPIRVTAIGLADVGVNTMANILKTTFSYYTFLRSL